MGKSAPQTLQEFLDQAADAVAHIDVAPAARLFHQVDTFIQPDTYATWDAESAKQVQYLLMQLRLTAFPALSDEEAADVMRTGLLEFFMFGISLEDQLTIRYVFVGYDAKNVARERIKKAILENGQKLGALTIGEWLRAFDKAFPVETRTEESILTFLTQDMRVTELRKEEMYVLKSLLRVYETLIVSPIIDIFDVAAYNESVMNQSQSGGAGMFGGAARSVTPTQERIWGDALQRSRAEGEQRTEPTETLQLLDALAKYPRINEQRITTERMRIKSEREPAAPSVRNWLRAYRDVLGIGRHSSADRGKFLFQNENTKSLPTGERDRVAFLLKALDENEPVTVFPKQQSILFPVQSAPVAPTASVWQGAATQRGNEASPTLRPGKVVLPPGWPQQAAAPAFPEMQSSPMPDMPPTVQEDSLQFSTGHVLPGEKVMLENAVSSGELSRPVFPAAPMNESQQASTPQSNIIRPAGPGSNDIQNTRDPRNIISQLSRGRGLEK